MIHNLWEPHKSGAGQDGRDSRCVLEDGRDRDEQRTEQVLLIGGAGGHEQGLEAGMGLGSLREGEVSNLRE